CQGASGIAACKVGRLFAASREPPPPIEWPATASRVESIPRTATGKIQKFKLRQPYWSGQERGVS
ncbi:MAG: hypothetical protein ACRDSQ_24505, partial [Actinokineospora sp.]